MINSLLLILTSAIGGALAYYLLIARQLNHAINRLKNDLNRSNYETEILSELEDRIGTSMDPVRVAEIIVGSLGKIIEYHTVSFIVLDQTQKHLIFKCSVRQTVNKEFVQQHKDILLEELSALHKTDLAQLEVQKQLSGLPLSDQFQQKLNSHYSIPLKIDNKITGIISVASAEKNFYTPQKTAGFQSIINRASNIVSRMQWLYDSGKSMQEEKRLEIEQRAYQAEVLKELNERIGYSTDENKIIEVITGSISRLLEFDTVAYMIKTDHHITFKIDLRESVSRMFVQEVKHKMLQAFSVMLNQDLANFRIDESITGTIFNDSVSHPIGSYFNLPLVINNQPVGLINVSSIKEGKYTGKETSVLYNITTQTASSISQLRKVLDDSTIKLNSLVSSLTEGLVMVDPEFNLLVINPASRRLLHLPVDKKLTTLDVFSALAEKADLRTLIQKALNEDRVTSIPDLALNENNVKISALPVRDSKNQLLGAVVVLQNITEEIALQRLREQFEAMVVHELRSPLTNIRGIADSLLRETSPLEGSPDEHRGGALEPDQVIKPLDTIKQQSSDMLELVNDLLDVSKLESGKFTVTKRPENLPEIIEQVINNNQTRARDKNIELKSDFQGSLNNIPMDSFRIRQVLTNLVNNAIKFTDTGSVTVSARRNDDGARVAVVDTGPGITNENKIKLFNKFIQFEQSRSQSGTGLGLVISKGIIEAHGGQIGVDSEPGQGSKFWFTLPAA